MSAITQITVGTTDYDIKDANALPDTTIENNVLSTTKKIIIGTTDPSSVDTSSWDEGTIYFYIDET